MKLFKKTFSLLAVAALCLGFFFGNSVTASAEESTTWYLKYVDANSEWRWQKGTWEDNGYHRELYYMQQEIKDGDVIVIDGTQGIDLSVDVYLKNVTISKSGMANVTAKGYDEVYILNDTTASIYGDVKDAYVYDNCKVNFFNNVGTLRMLSDRNPYSNSSVNALGTVTHLSGKGSTVAYELYSFQPNTLKIIDGIPQTKEGTFSTTPPATTTTPSTPATNNNSNSNNDYDDVPKTGDDGLMNPLVLVAIAAVCAFGAYKLRK